jgi:cell wall-associated NlpC family hydrolase
MTLDTLMRTLSQGTAMSKAREDDTSQRMRMMAAQQASGISGVSHMGGHGGNFAGGGDNSVIQMAHKLGRSAGKYVWGATGPNAYDCSGLVWRTLVKTGKYNGPRFTTSTIGSSGLKRVGNPQRGDIVVWPGHHMGFVLGPNRMYSAKSPSAGIGRNTISGDAGYFGRKPVYYRA